MRIGFTIVFNGLHHLLADDFSYRMAKYFDRWYIAEGAVYNEGSTKWCKEMPTEYHDRGRSVDGTWDHLRQLTHLFPNVIIVNNILICQKTYMKNGFWKGKDSQVNACIHAMKLQKTEPCYLWQIDADEVWREPDLNAAELLLEESGCRVGTFSCNYWVGKGLVTSGIWGEGQGANAYKRLWKWDGEWFKSHEPPILGDGSLAEYYIPIRFNHYAYYYEKDVKFKNDWYGGHEGICKKWKWLQEDAKNRAVGYEWPISTLLDPKTYWGKTDTSIVKVK